MSVLHPGTTSVDLALWALRRFPERVAFVDRKKDITYGACYERVSQLAQGLSALGLKRGDGVAFLVGNVPDAFLTLLAARAIGCRGTTLHPLGSADDHAFIVEDAEASALVFNPSLFEARASEIAERGAGLAHVLSLGPSSVAKDLAEAAAAQVPARIRAVMEQEDISLISYTGGTTGYPKGIAIPDRTIVEAAQTVPMAWQLPHTPRYLAATPISHAAGALILPTWMLGGTVILHLSFDPEEFCRAVEAYRINTVFVVPTMIYSLLDHLSGCAHDLSSLELVVYGAAPISPARLADALEVLGQVFVQIYGQTEAGPTITALRKEEHDLARPHLLASCGRPLQGNVVEIHDDDDNEASPGEIGEICLRGRLVSNGYWKRPQETAETFRNNWLHTGDMAHADEDGYYYIVDRKKDMIISGGFNVFPREIEDVLTAHLDVAQAAVIGVPDKKWGEAVKAIVVPRSGASPRAEELIALVRMKKGPVYAPKSVEFWEDIPLTGLGKPDKKAIRARFWGDAQRQVQ